MIDGYQPNVSDIHNYNPINLKQCINARDYVCLYGLANKDLNGPNYNALSALTGQYLQTQNLALAQMQQTYSIYFSCNAMK